MNFTQEFRKTLEPDSSSPLKTCAHCGRQLDVSAFIHTNSLFYPDGYSPWCAQCIEELLVKNEFNWDTVDKICQFLDIPFKPDLFEDLKSQNGSGVFPIYCAMFTSQSYEKFNWSRYFQHYQELERTREIESEIPLLRDEQRKNEQRRVNSQETSTETEVQTPASAPETSTESEVSTTTPPADINTSSLSTLIIKEVIKHGGMTLYNNVTTDDGQNISLTLAQFVDFDLKNDGLQFAEPLYNQILAEAVEHSTEEDFDSERYFTLHPDYDISSLAIRLCADNVILSKSLQVEVTPYTMQEQINHMLLDFRNEYIMHRIKLLTKEISHTNDQPDRQLELMAELKEAQQLRSMIARKIGNSVVSRRL